jgi:hypothetical protein
MATDIVLVPGPPVRAASLLPTAGELRAAGMCVEVPDVLTVAQPPPLWSDWAGHVASLVSFESRPALVGYSAATPLVAQLASRRGARGVIMLDGDVPPPNGLVTPVRPAFREFIRSLADQNGLLPPWSQWWSADARRASLIGIDRLDSEALASLEIGLPRMHVDWFDDAIELAPWAHIPAGYIRTSGFYDHAADEAERRGWPVVRLQGTHLHPMLAPAETASAIGEIARKFGCMPPP